MLDGSIHACRAAKRLRQSLRRRCERLALAAATTPSTLRRWLLALRAGRTMTRSLPSGCWIKTAMAIKAAMAVCRASRFHLPVALPKQGASRFHLPVALPKQGAPTAPDFPAAAAAQHLDPPTSQLSTCQPKHVHLVAGRSIRTAFLSGGLFV